MDNELFCTNCDEYRGYTKRLTEVVHAIKGEEIIVKIELPYCIECGNQLSDIDIEEKHFDMALTEYRKRNRLLQPNEIKSIREFYGLSQRAFSRALGFAEPTINRYEQGAIQDSLHNNIIKLVRKPENMISMAEDNKANLSVKEFESICQNANALMSVEKGSVTPEFLRNELEKHTNEIKAELSKMYTFAQKNSSKIDVIEKKLSTMEQAQPKENWNCWDSYIKNTSPMFVSEQEDFCYSEVN